jgi:hypothetical protein
LGKIRFIVTSIFAFTSPNNFWSSLRKASKPNDLD